MGGKTVKGKALKIEPAELKPSAMEMHQLQQQDQRQRQAALAMQYGHYMNFVRQTQMAGYLQMQYMAAAAMQQQQMQMAAAMAAAEEAVYDEDGDEVDYSAFSATG